MIDTLLTLINTVFWIVGAVVSVTLGSVALLWVLAKFIARAQLRRLERQKAQQPAPPVGG